MPSATDGEDGFNLNIPDGIAFADINGTTYAIVNALNSRNLQMIDLSDPANPTAAAGFGGRGADDFAALDFTNVASAEIGGRHYALGAAPYDGKIWIIDVTNPDVLYPTAILAEPWEFPHEPWKSWNPEAPTTRWSQTNCPAKSSTSRW